MALFHVYSKQREINGIALWHFRPARYIRLCTPESQYDIPQRCVIPRVPKHILNRKHSVHNISSLRKLSSKIPPSTIWELPFTKGSKRNKYDVLYHSVLSKRYVAYSKSKNDLTNPNDNSKTMDANHTNTTISDNNTAQNKRIHDNHGATSEGKKDSNNKIEGTKRFLTHSECLEAPPSWIFHSCRIQKTDSNKSDASTSTEPTRDKDTIAALEFIDLAERALLKAREATLYAKTNSHYRWNVVHNEVKGAADAVEKVLKHSNKFAKTHSPYLHNERKSHHINETSEASIATPSKQDLWMLALAGGIPFLGFGFVDNFVMIVAGDMFDTTLCVALGFSTMVAAALGNWLSDLLGIWMGSWIENISSSIKSIPRPSLSKEQLELPLSRRYYYIGSAIGISIGCLLGMCPLLLLDTKEGARLKNEKEEDSLIFVELMHMLEDYLAAEKVVFYRVDPIHQCFKTILENEAITLPLDAGIPGEAYRTMKLINWRPSHSEDLKQMNATSIALHLQQRQQGPAPNIGVQPEELELIAHQISKSDKDTTPESHTVIETTPIDHDNNKALDSESTKPLDTEDACLKSESPTTIIPRDERLVQGLEPRQILGAPVFGFDGVVIGVVEVLNPIDRPQFSRADKEFLINICSHLAVEFEGKHHMKKILEMCKRQVATRRRGDGLE